MSGFVKRLKRLVPAVAVASALIVFGGATISQAAPVAPKNYIVVFKDSANVTTEFNWWKSKRLAVFDSFRAAFKGMTVRADSNQLKQLRQDPDVLYVEQDSIVSIETTQSGATWGIDRVDQQDLPLSGTYEYNFAGSGVNVYVVDTGILSSHSQFTGRILPGYTAISDRRGTNDCNGHGTHVAGTIGGTTYGVAKSVNLTPVRVLDCRGSGTTSGVLAGLNWIAQRTTPGTQAVVNMSLGGGFSSSINTAVQNIISRGIPVVVAAGNSASNACDSSPAAAPNAITVGATEINDNFASYSNRGSCVDILAPGSDITSAYSSGSTSAATLSGTSMASPHVAGAVALLFENGYKSPAELSSMLLANSVDSTISLVPSGTLNKFLFTGSAVQSASLTPNTVIVTGQVGSPIAATAALVESNFTGQVSYSITPALVSGLSMDTGTGVISGTPNATSSASHTITATDGTRTATATVSVNISPAPVPTISPSTQPVSATVGSAVATEVLVPSGPFTGTVRYAISTENPLPAGLGFNSLNGQISGTPTEPMASTTYTITGTGTTGTATATITISVADAPAPAITPSSHSVSGTRGVYLSSQVLTYSGYFVGTVSYSISGTLPSGLNFNTSNGQITGTPTVSLAQTSYTITATGSDRGRATASVTLTIAEPPTNAAPGAPTNVFAEVSGSRRAALSWTAGATNGAAVTSQTIRVYEVRNGSARLVSTINYRSASTSVTVTGLTRGRQYQFTVSATNRFGTSSQSALSNSITAR